MNAHYTLNGIPRNTKVWMEQREDGSTGPPVRFEISERSCPYSEAKVYVLQLEKFDLEANTAVYTVRTQWLDK